jgi:o-succinylbenzoate synthase
VTIARATLVPFRLRLRASLRTGHGPLGAREGFALRLRATDGSEGWGEALPLRGFGQESLEVCGRALAELVRRILAKRLGAAAALDLVDEVATGAPCARAALECALLDVAARGRGESLGRAWGWQRRRVAVAALVSGDEPSACARDATRSVSRGFRALKLKVGGGDRARDAARVAAVRGAVGPRVELRLDANGAWQEHVALDFLAEVSRLGIAFVEQPVPADDLDGLARVRAAGVPVAADEAAASEAAAARVLDRGAADLVVVKPACLGGLRAARRVALRAAAVGVPVVVTSSLDSIVGRSAALHLAATLPEPLPAAGLATGSLLLDDLGPDRPVLGGALSVPDGPGLGIAPHEDALGRLATGPPLELSA